MNHYGQLARDHWMEWLPERFAAIENPETFFTGLGQQIHSQIDTLYQATLTTMPADLPAEEIDGWKNMARQMATDQILTELAYLAPETDEEDWLPEEEGWRDRWPGTILTDVIQESYDRDADQPLT